MAMRAIAVEPRAGPQFKRFIVIIRICQRLRIGSLNKYVVDQFQFPKPIDLPIEIHLPRQERQRPIEITPMTPKALSSTGKAIGLAVDNRR